MKVQNIYYLYLSFYWLTIWHMLIGNIDSFV